MSINIIIPSLDKPIINKPSHKQPYRDAIQQANGNPILMELHELKRAEISDIHGILLTGGHDIDPSTYGCPREIFTRYTYKRRDTIDLEFARIAFSYDIPILGICRGMQIMYVLNGGQLYQDISAYRHNEKVQIQHTYEDHEINVEDHDLFRNIIATDKFLVNSSHHQCIAYKESPKLNADYPFKIGAVSDDGIAESIYAVTHPFALGVQYHPERLTTKHDHKIFRSFITHAERKKNDTL